MTTQAAPAQRTRIVLADVERLRDPPHHTRNSPAEPRSGDALLRGLIRAADSAQPCRVAALLAVAVSGSLPLLFGLAPGGGPGYRDARRSLAVVGAGGLAAQPFLYRVGLPLLCAGRRNGMRWSSPTS